MERPEYRLVCMTLPTDPIAWTDDFLLGYGPMDATHREFVDCVSALQACGDDRVLERLRAFEAHALAHFGEEQQWMSTTAFPAAGCHDDEHAAVLKSVRQVRLMLEEDPGQLSLANARALAVALAEWFPGHAQHMDSALSHWMSTQRFGGKPIVLKRTPGSRPD
jgi:hemerythrin